MSSSDSESADESTKSITTPKIDFNTFLNGFRKHLNVDINGYPLPRVTLDSTIFNKKLLNKLEADCSVDLFTNGQEKSFDDEKKYYSDLPENSVLETIKLRRELKLSAETLKTSRKTNLRYHINKSPWIHHCIKKRSITDISIEGVNSLITVAVYKPLYKDEQKNHKLKPHLSHYIQILGCQTLADLRDIILCNNDNILVDNIATPASVDNHLNIRRTTKDVYPSGTIFIEDVFYNDERREDFVDYSCHIIDWSFDERRGVGPFRSEKMETTRLDQLTNIRMGHPYLYMHQGDCEHWITFTDIRVLDRNDCNNKEAYPLIVGRQKDVEFKCRMCLNRVARWMTKQSSLQCKDDPCFFCEPCFKAMFVNPRNGQFFQKISYNRLPLDHD